MFLTGDLIEQRILDRKLCVCAKNLKSFHPWDSAISIAQPDTVISFLSVVLSALILESHVLQGRETVFFLIILLFLPSFSRCFRLFGLMQIYFHTQSFQPAFEDSFVLSLTLLRDIVHLFYSYFIFLLFELLGTFIFYF